MSSATLVEAGVPGCNGGFDLRTVHVDTHRVSLCASGTLDAANAPLLAAVIDGHVRNRRRFMRMDVAELIVDGDEAVAVLASVHRQLLDVRGTLVLTSVHKALYATLAGAGLASELFLVAPTACERGDCPV